mmetsp:Transcript_26582/g.58871  ORF Transcript_26582/g.58871 Transcript_26582/m.58871 type:complete len:149 (-) Transcript_26582:1122-1568(-)
MGQEETARPVRRLWKRQRPRPEQSLMQDLLGVRQYPDWHTSIALHAELAVLSLQTSLVSSNDRRTVPKHKVFAFPGSPNPAAHTPHVWSAAQGRRLRATQSGARLQLTAFMAVLKTAISCFVVSVSESFCAAASAEKSKAVPGVTRTV